MVYAQIIGGKQLEANAAAAFNRLAEAYKARWGSYPGVTSALRTYAEQQRLYNGWIRRLPGFNLAARPGTSLHEKGLSVDLSAPNNVSSTAQHQWLVANAPAYGFKWTGAGFHPVEAWHFDYIGGGSAGSPAFNQDVKNRQAFLNLARGEKLVVDGVFGGATKAAIIRYQRFLGITADGIWGGGTQAAHQRYYDSVWAPSQAPKIAPAPATNGSLRAVQQALKNKYPAYAGRLVVDGINGPATKAAVREFQRRSGLVADGIAGPKTRARLGV